MVSHRWRRPMSSSAWPHRPTTASKISQSVKVCQTTCESLNLIYPIAAIYLFILQSHVFVWCVCKCAWLTRNRRMTVSAWRLLVQVKLHVRRLVSRLSVAILQIRRHVLLSGGRAGALNMQNQSLHIVQLCHCTQPLWSSVRETPIVVWLGLTSDSLTC